MNKTDLERTIHILIRLSTVIVREQGISGNLFLNELSRLVGVRNSYDQELNKIIKFEIAEDKFNKLTLDEKHILAENLI